MKDRTRRPNVSELGIIAVLSMAISVLLALVSVALYRVEREEIDGDSNADTLPESSK